MASTTITNTSSTTELPNYWISDDIVQVDNTKEEQSQYQHDQQAQTIHNYCICVGTGRFLRSVLVPILQQCGYSPILIQTRGRTFIDYMLMRSSSTCTGTTTTTIGNVSAIDTSPAYDTSTDDEVPAIVQQQQQQPTTTTYEIDTILSNGTVQTTTIPCYGVFSFGTEECKNDIYSLLIPKLLSSSTKPLSIIGIGVTEAGLVSATTQVMIDLYDLFCSIQQKYYNSTSSSTSTEFSTQQQQQQQQQQQNKICVINTDNVPNNGIVLFQHMITLCQQNKCTRMEYFFNNYVVFINSMVDRITSHRDSSDNDTNNTMYNVVVPKCEPIPKKALVLLDTFPILSLPYKLQELATTTTTTTNNNNINLGLLIRTNQQQFTNDIALKLRIANGTHTAIAHVMALINLPMTDTLSLAVQSQTTTETETTTTTETETTTTLLDTDSIKTMHHAKLLMEYIDCLINNQIIPAAVASPTMVDCTIDDIQLVWDDWKQRLLHPYFGLSTFFITQNGASKGGIRLGPTIIDLIQLTVTKEQRSPSDDLSTTGSTIPITTTPTPPTTGISVVMSYAFAVILRWLTPKCDSTNINGVYTGWLQNSSCTKQPAATAIGTGNESVLENTTVITYADGLRYNLIDGWYEFRCSLQVPVSDNDTTTSATTTTEEVAMIPFSEVLQTLVIQQQQNQPTLYVPIIKKYLCSNDGGNMNTIAIMYPEIFNTFVMSIAILYSRMIIDNNHVVDTILHEMSSKEISSIYNKDGMNTDCSVLVEYFSNNTCTIDTVKK